jgi:hypothetical protein
LIGSSAAKKTTREIGYSFRLITSDHIYTHLVYTHNQNKSRAQANKKIYMECSGVLKHKKRT